MPLQLTSMKELLSSIVDYAGLFPPATLDLQQAMTNYAQYSRGADRWMLGRFVLPLSQLDEFAHRLPVFPEQQWPLSLILSGDLQTAINQVRSFRHRQIAIQALEFSLLTLAAIEQVLPSLPGEMELFFEVPCTRELEGYLPVLRQIHAAAKIRTGGITAAAFPSSAQLCQAILALAEARIPFKATAGLHHPFLGNYPLTDAPDSTSTWMQGFLTVATVAMLAFKYPISFSEALEIAQTSSIAGIQFGPDRLSWKGYDLTDSDLTAARQQGFRSFGSCSFQHPIAELKALNLL